MGPLVEGHRVTRIHTHPLPHLYGVDIRAQEDELPAVDLTLLGDQRLDRIPGPLVAGVLHAVGHDQADHPAGPLILGKCRELFAHLGDELPGRVEQCGHSAGHDDELRHRGDGGGRVQHLVGGVELGQRHLAVLGLRALGVDQLTPAVLGGLGGAGHRAGAVKQRGDQGLIGVGHGSPLC